MLGVGLLARALFGFGLGEPQLGDPVELTGEAAAGAVGACRDAQVDAVGVHGHDVPGVEAMWAAPVLLVEQRGDLQLVVMEPHEEGEEYLAYCLLERGGIVVRGVGGFAEDVWLPHRAASTDDGPPHTATERLIWGQAPPGTVAVAVDSPEGVTATPVWYPEAGIYTMVWPEGTMVRGEVEFTLEDGSTETVDL